MKYTRELLAAAAAKSHSIAGVLRVLGIPWTGGSHAHISRRLRHFGIDTSHFTGMAHNRGKSSPHRLRPDEILIVRPAGARRAKPHHLRRALVEMGVPYSCAGCDNEGEWLGEPLILHVDHINGDFCDSRLDNLRFLCPNCHTQTATYAGRAKRCTNPGSQVRPTDDCA
jgi:hypothetical protein